jgi:glycosyltransferase involved in cell wall biosynthesis
VHYKNFYFLLQCAQSLLQANRDLKIVCVGAGFNEKEQAYFRDLGIANQVLQYNASDAALANLYQHATAFVYPSLYEGFGMPLLEAFQMNCPVITSQASSLPEVAGDAAYYIDPKSTASIRGALQTLLTHEGVRQDLIQKGKVQLKKFSWQTTAHKTFELYKSLA